MSRRSDYRWEDRPDGTNATHYKMKGWSKRRVVWEFLRRSKRYQRACNEVYEAQRGDIADVSPSEYGYRIPIKRLIDYCCDWGEAEKSLEFVAKASVLQRSTTESEEENPFRLSFQIDLEPIRRNKAILNLRLRQIKRQCEKRLSTYTSQKKKVVTSRRFRAEPMTRSLQYLDLRASGHSARQIGAQLYGEGKSAENRSRMLDKDRKRARRMLKSGLRDLMVSALLDPNGVISASISTPTRPDEYPPADERTF